MRKILTIVLIFTLLPIFSGCSVMMAMHGKPEPNLSAIHEGQNRDEVIMLLGSEPAKTMTTEDGMIDIFYLERGNAPNAGRAIGHAVLDVLTWGAWEIIGTPVEAMTSSTMTLTIEYTKDVFDVLRITKIITGEPQA